MDVPVGAYIDVLNISDSEYRRLSIQ
jgi:hypothetical protein